MNLDLIILVIAYIGVGAGAVSGVLEAECSRLMQEFFRMRRSGNDKAGEVPKWS